jgi:hypothetical protein
MDEKNVEEKKCPFCAEIVKAAAIKCRFCGSDLNLDVRAAPLSCAMVLTADMTVSEIGTGINNNKNSHLYSALPKINPKQT